MNKQQAFDALACECDLKPADFYFLELIPLIEMIWADGHNQPAELALLYKFTIEHMSRLDRDSGIPFATVDEANDFLDRFAHQRPSPLLLEKLRELALQPATSTDVSRRRNILEYCMDIAAACTTRYPFGFRERIMESEKELLRELFSAFNCSTDEAR